jgi:hypothetical protein
MTKGRATAVCYPPKTEVSLISGCCDMPFGLMVTH